MRVNSIEICACFASDSLQIQADKRTKYLREPQDGGSRSTMWLLVEEVDILEYGGGNNDDSYYW